MTTLHKRTAAAAKWSAFDVILRQGMQFLVTIALARLLTPEDFGVVALLAIFVGVAGILIDSGLGAALVQRREVTHTDESSIFFFNLGMGAVMALALCAAAPAIANFFDKPVLEPLAQVMAFNLFLNAFGTIHTALLNREMNYRTLAKANAAGALIAGALAVWLAAQGYGVWSLAAGTVVTSLVSVALLWLWHPWRPTWTFSFAALRTYLRFGAYEMAASLADVFSTNLYLVMLGKMHSARDVGIYDRAQRTQQLPITVMMGIINRVAYTAFATISEDKLRLAKGLRQAQSLSMLVNVPVLLLVILLAEPLVLVLFGRQWLPCVPILQVLGLGGLLWPMHVLNLNVLRAQGRADLFFWITIFKKAFTISLTVAASFHGVIAVAWAQVAISIFAYGVNTHYTGKFLAYGGVEQLLHLKRIFFAACPMVAVVYFLDRTIDSSPLISLITMGTIGGIVYLLACRLLCAELLDNFLTLAGLRKPLAVLDRMKP